MDGIPPLFSREPSPKGNDFNKPNKQEVAERSEASPLVFESLAQAYLARQENKPEHQDYFSWAGNKSGFERINTLEKFIDFLKREFNPESLKDLFKKVNKLPEDKQDYFYQLKSKLTLSIKWGFPLLLQFGLDPFTDENNPKLKALYKILNESESWVFGRLQATNLKAAISIITALERFKYLNLTNPDLVKRQFILAALDPKFSDEKLEELYDLIVNFTTISVDNAAFELSDHRSFAPEKEEDERYSFLKDYSHDLSNQGFEFKDGAYVRSASPADIEKVLSDFFKENRSEPQKILMTTEEEIISKKEKIKQEVYSSKIDQIIIQNLDYEDQPLALYAEALGQAFDTESIEKLNGIINELNDKNIDKLQALGSIGYGEGRRNLFLELRLFLTCDLNIVKPKHNREKRLIKELMGFIEDNPEIVYLRSRIFKRGHSNFTIALECAKKLGANHSKHFRPLIRYLIAVSKSYNIAVMRYYQSIQSILESFVHASKLETIEMDLKRFNRYVTEGELFKIRIYRLLNTIRDSNKDSLVTKLQELSKTKYNNLEKLEEALQANGDKQLSTNQMEKLGIKDFMNKIWLLDDLGFNFSKRSDIQDSELIEIANMISPINFIELREETGITGTIHSLSQKGLDKSLIRRFVKKLFNKARLDYKDLKEINSKAHNKNKEELTKLVISHIE